MGERAAKYLDRSAEALWWTDVAVGSTLYVQYNRVVPVDSARIDELRALAGSDQVSRVVIDIRHNFGGETDAYEPLLDALIDIDAEPSALYVVIGRNTFSTASLFAADVERETDAVFVGEPMGGSPNLFGDPSEVTLPFTGIAVSVAGEYYVRSTEDDPRLTIEPDVATPLSAADYFAGIDPALEAILERP
jgi:C-terminal processing protease CtpA/Prc